MGALLSRVGSDNFYAAYERNFERLKAQTVKLQRQNTLSQQRRQRLSSSIFWYAIAVWGALCAYATWVVRHRPGTYSVRGHFLRVVPVFAWPVAAWALHAAVLLLTNWKAKRNTQRLQRSQAKMRKMLTDLKDSTHYDKTLELLRKYDPEFAAAERRQRAKLAAQSPKPHGSPATPPGQVAGGASPRQLTGLVGSGIRGAGSRMFPALDYLATSLIGDNPALTGALREARSEGEALRLRLARAESRVRMLEATNAELRERLGEPPAAEPPLSEPTTPTALGAAERAQDLMAAVADAARDAPAGDQPEHVQQGNNGHEIHGSAATGGGTAAGPAMTGSAAGSTSAESGQTMLPALSLSALLPADANPGEEHLAAPCEQSSRAGGSSSSKHAVRSSGAADEGFEFRRRQRPGIRGE